MPEILVRRQRRREHLERYLPVEPLVLGAEDHRHSAPADLLLQPVPGNPRAGGETGQEPGRSRALNAHHVSRGGRNGAIRINKADPTPCSRPHRPARMTLTADSVPQASTTATSARAD